MKFKVTYLLKTIIFCLILIYSLTINIESAGRPVSSNQIFSGENKQLQLTEKEQNWIKANPKISVAMMKSYPPFSYLSEKDNKLKGLSVDLYSLLAAKTGLEFKFEPGFWSNNLKKFKNKQVELIDGISYNQKRKDYTLYTDPYYKVPLVVYLRKDNNWYQDPKDLVGKKIGITKKVFYKKHLKENLTNDIIEKENNEQLIKSLAFSEVDAVITNSAIGEFYIQKNLLKNIKLAGEYNNSKIKKEDLRIGVQKKQPILKDIIQKGLNSISEAEWTRLKDKWLGLTEQNKNQSQMINLNKEEQEFVANHPVIKVSNDERWPPFDFAVSGQPFGLSIDLMNMLAKRLGIEIKYVRDTWSGLLNKFKQREIDVLHSAYKTENRERFALFTQPYYNDQTVFIVRKDAAEVSNIKELYGKTIALPKGWASKPYFLKNHPQVSILSVNNIEEALKKVEQKKVDATIALSSIAKYFIKKNLVENIKISGWFEEYDQGEFRSLHFMVRDDWPILKQMLEKALATVTPGEIAKLEEKWINNTKNSSSSYLTVREKEYLKNKGSISIAVNPDWMPFEKINNQGEHEGIIARFYDLLSNKLGVPIKLIPTNSRSESLAQAKSGQADIISAVFKTDEDLNYTKPYISYPLVIATRQEKLYISSLKIVENKKIGVSQDCPLYNIIEEKYPEIDFIKVKDTKTGLEKVQAGELFGLVNTAPAIGYIIQQEHMFDLKISGELIETLDLRIGVKKDERLLFNILDRALDSINKKEKEDIFNSWLTINYEQGFNYSLFIRIMLGVAIVGVFVLYRQFQLKRFNNKLSSLNQELAQANQKLENISFIDGLTQIPNRRKFDDFLAQEWKHCKRDQHNLSLIMLDLDFFKQFNDSYGHLAGDDCLKQIAKTIEDCIKRPKDLAARYGGEEFIVVLPETKKEGAKKVASRMKEAIVDLKIEHQDSKVSPYVTVSLGVASIIPSDQISSEEFVDAVDNALYQAKQAGRNRIEATDLNDRE